MKEIIRLSLVLVAFICFNFNTLKAQERFRFGLQAGAGVATFGTYDDNIAGREIDNTWYYGLAKNYFTPSFSFNIYAAYRVNNHFNIVLEPGFARKGTMNKLLMENSTIIHRHTQLNYIQLPVSVEYMAMDKLYFTLGPEFSYLTSAYFSSEQGRADVTPVYNDNRFDAGIQGGAYYSITSHWDAGLKAGQSLTKTDDLFIANEAGELVEKINFKNRYFQLFVRYKF